MAEQRFSDGQQIFRSGDSADGVYRVRAGGVRAAWPGPEEAAREALFRSGDIFGEADVLTGGSRSFSTVAVGEVQVDFLHRNDILARLSEDSRRLTGLVAELFSPLLFPAEDGGEAGGAPVADDAATVVAGSTPDIRLVPDGKRVRSIVDADEISVGQLPFSVGRSVSGGGSDSYGDVTLVLDDSRPFSLSRRHFTIDAQDGILVVRDDGSYHGTMVNGLRLGDDQRSLTAPLMIGENDVVAGPADSPFRFRVIVG